MTTDLIDGGVKCETGMSDLTTKETHTEPVDLTTTFDPNSDTVVVDPTSLCTIVAGKVEIMNYYYKEGEHNKRQTSRCVREHFKRPTFSPSSLRKKLKKKLIRQGKSRGSMNLECPRSPQ